MEEVVNWVREVHDRHLGHTGLSLNNKMSNQSKSSQKIIFHEIAANTALVYTHVACSLLSMQIERLANDFEKKGGFTERLYKIRQKKR